MKPTAAFQLTRSNPRDSGPIPLLPSLRGPEYREIGAQCRALNILFERLPELTSSALIRKESRRLLNDELLTMLYQTMTKVTILMGRCWDLLSDPEHGRHAFENRAIPLHCKQLAIIQCAYELGWTERHNEQFEREFMECMRKMPKEAPVDRAIPLQPFGVIAEGVSEEGECLYFRLRTMYEELATAKSSDALRQVYERYLTESQQQVFFSMMRNVCITEGWDWDAKADPECGMHAFENMAVPTAWKQLALSLFAFQENVASDPDPTFPYRLQLRADQLHEEEVQRAKDQQSFLKKVQRFLADHAPR